MTAPPFDASSQRHAEDGELLALHDGERSPELDLRRRHVERCAECQGRLAVISAESRRVRESLATIPIPHLDANVLRARMAARRTRQTVPWWRRPTAQAAAAIVVLTVAAAASPARHWLGERFGRAAARIVSTPSQNEPAAAPRPLSGATVSFPPSGPTFTIRLDVSPLAGSLTVERTTDDQISVQVASGAGTGGDAMVVLPSELRVRNTTSSRASYKLTIPSGVTRVVVIVAGRTMFDGVPPANVKLAR